MSTLGWFAVGFAGASAFCLALLWWGGRALERDTRRTREWAEERLRYKREWADWERRLRG